MKKLILSIFLLSGIFKGQVEAQTVAEGLRYLDNEQFLNAGQVFRGLASSQPNANHYYYLGNYYMTLERMDSVQGVYADSAKMMFEKGMVADPKSALNLVGLGTYEVYKGRAGQGKILIDKAIQTSKSKDAEVLYRAAEAFVYYPQNDALEANRLLDMALKINKNAAEYQILKGDAFMLKNDGSAAANCYDAAKRIAPNSAKGFIKYGNILIRAKSYTEALKSYIEGMGKDSLYAPGYRQLGELYYKAGKYENAVQAYSKYVRMTDQRPENQFRFGAFLFLSKNYLQAIEVLNALPQGYKNDYKYRLLAYCQSEQQQPAEGLANMETFLSKVDTSRQIVSDYEYYGRLLVESGKDTLGGLMMLAKAAKKDSTKFKSLTDMSRRFFDGKRYLKAAQVYEILDSLGRNSPQEMYVHGQAYFFGKDYVKADTLFSRILIAQPTSFMANLFKARCITFQKLDPDQTKGLAKPYYERFTQLVTGENIEKYKKQLTEAYGYLGSYYGRRKDIPNAEASYRKVLELDPNNKTAKEALSGK
jgi:tetratricopeptide (TPR) repeat protein